MEIIKTIKEKLENNEMDLEEIRAIQHQLSDIADELIRIQVQEELKQKTDDANQWATRVMEAREKTRARNKSRTDVRKQSRLSGARKRLLSLRDGK